MISSDDELRGSMLAMGLAARRAARATALVDGETKSAALRCAADEIDRAAATILSTNRRDIKAANELSAALIDRMSLSEDRVRSISRSLREIAALGDPVGEVIEAWSRPNGLEIERIRTPIGVIAVIYESRPNVTADAAAIALMAGNAVILRGGSECLATSRALFDCVRFGLDRCGLPVEAAQFVATPDRRAVGEILSGLGGAVDLIVPRGGASLVARVQAEARAPVLAHLEGLCHVYVDRSADPDMAEAIVFNSKMRRPGVCGAAETLLIDAPALAAVWPRLGDRLRAAGCEIRGDAALRAADPAVIPASEEDWETEYLAPVLSVRVVDGVESAVDHIERYSSGHTESIVANDEKTAEAFLRRVDSAIVLHNASTQFADGGEFGLGAEIGIATGRLHARGPVGVKELTTYKNVVRGSGQVRP